MNTRKTMLTKKIKKFTHSFGVVKKMVIPFATFHTKLSCTHEGTGTMKQERKLF